MLICSQQTAYGTLISDLLVATEKFKTKGYVVPIDIEKAFDSLDNSFLLTSVLELTSLIGLKSF